MNIEQTSITTKWYDDLQGVENLNKYSPAFIEWINEEDSWAITYTYKYKITKLINLFELWVDEKY